MGFKLDESYNTVAERIAEFRAKHPEGSLQPADLSKPFSIEMVNGNQCFVVTAAAYRSPDDQRPGIGMAYEPVPGATQFTRGSELQNAETAAWGRAIVAALAADTNKGIASRDEIQARQPEPQQRPPAQPTPQQLADKALTDAGTDLEKLQAVRAWATRAEAPKEYLDRVEAAITKAEETQPLEGTLIP
jgi:hypothetical protein